MAHGKGRDGEFVAICQVDRCTEVAKWRHGDFHYCSTHRRNLTFPACEWENLHPPARSENLEVVDLFGKKEVKI